MKTIKQFIGIALVLALIWSCEGPEGPEGPAGQSGTKGEKGDQGNQGIQGVKGNSGNANVKYEDFDVENWGNLTDSADNNIGFYAILLATNISKDIVNTGFVKVLMTLDTSKATWYNLPYTFITNSDTDDYFTIYNYIYWEGRVEITKYWSNGEPTTLPPSRRYFRVVAIAGEQYSYDPHFKFSNYSEMKREYPGHNQTVVLK